MKIVLASLNARYIYSNLALYELRSFCQTLPHQFIIKEYTINEQVLDIAGDLHRKKAELIAFSCYIWNIEPILKICAVLKKTNPQLMIVLGGPEVSYDPEEILNSNSALDVVIPGEGEESFYQFLESCGKEHAFENIPGLVWRNKHQVVRNIARPLIQDLDRLPFPFTGEDLIRFAGKIVYFETSRGCPFHCQYCLSSTIPGVRFFSLDRVKNDLEKLISAGVKQVKFVDRTFNCHRQRTKEILAFLLRFKDRPINFHFEIAADLLDDEMIDLMGEAPAGFFQVEIGVQSTNPRVLELIQRKMDFAKVREEVTKLRSKGNVHLHLDLIAGLPGENLSSFAQSFDHVYNLGPDHLQLGFLKLLKGSGLRNRAQDFGLCFADHPPYEILMTGQISFDEMVELKKIEDIVEQYYNGRKYRYTLDYAINHRHLSPFQFYRGLARFWERTTWERMLRPETKTKLLLEYLIEIFPQDDAALFYDLVKLDWLLAEPRNTIPPWLGGGGKQDRTIDFGAYLPWAKGKTLKEIYKKIAVEEFQYLFVLDQDQGKIIAVEKKPCRGIIDYTRPTSSAIFIHPEKSGQ